VSLASESLYPGSICVAAAENGESVIVGGTDGVAGIFSIAENKLQKSFKAGSAITDAAWYGTEAVVSTTSGAIKLFGNSEMSFTSHAGSANGLAMHPCGDILASVGVDKSFVFYDLVAGKAVAQVYTDSGTFFNFSRHFLGNMKLTCVKSLQLRLSTLMDICSLLAVQTVKSNSSM
jgi:pre-mRNA-processing factor 19